MAGRLIRNRFCISQRALDQRAPPSQKGAPVRTPALSSRPPWLAFKNKHAFLVAIFSLTILFLLTIMDPPGWWIFPRPVLRENAGTHVQQSLPDRSSFVKSATATHYPAIQRMPSTSKRTRVRGSPKLEPPGPSLIASFEPRQS